MKLLSIRTNLPVWNLGTGTIEAKGSVTFEAQAFGVLVSGLMAKNENVSVLVPWQHIAWCRVETPAKAKA